MDQFAPRKKNIWGTFAGREEVMKERESERRKNNNIRPSTKNTWKASEAKPIQANVKQENSQLKNINEIPDTDTATKSTFNLIKKTKTNDFSEFQIKAEVTTFQNKVIGTQDVFFYKIDLESSLNKIEPDSKNNTWFIYHKLSDFKDLSTVFERFYINAPKLQVNQPSKSLSAEENKKIILSLNNFLASIIIQPDLLSSKYTINFLKLENHYPDISLYHPMELYELKDEVSFPITSSSFFREANLIFLGTGTRRENRIGSLLTKIGEFIKPPRTVTIKGELKIYNIIKNHNGESMFIDLYTKELQSEVSVINFFRERNCLCVGMRNGHIALFKLYINEPSSQTKDFIEFAGEVKNHTKEIVSCCINFDLGYIYSFAKENCVKISELNYQSLMKEYPITQKTICGVTIMSLSKVLVYDMGGNISILDLLTDPLKPKVLQTIGGMLTDVNCMKMVYKDSILGLGSTTGIVSLCRVNEIEISKLRDITLRQKIGVNDIVINERKELFIAMSNGSIAVFIHEEIAPEYIIDAHLRSITSIIWNEEKKAIISCSEDERVKMIQIPLMWPCELLRKNKMINSRRIIDDILGEHHQKTYSEASKNYVEIYNIDEYSIKQMYSEDLDGWSIID